MDPRSLRGLLAYHHPVLPQLLFFPHPLDPHSPRSAVGTRGVSQERWLYMLGLRPPDGDGTASRWRRPNRDRSPAPISLCVCWYQTLRAMSPKVSLKWRFLRKTYYKLQSKILLVFCGMVDIKEPWIVFGDCISWKEGFQKISPTNHQISTKYEKWINMKKWCLIIWHVNTDLFNTGLYLNRGIMLKSMKLMKLSFDQTVRCYVESTNKKLTDL